jgi:hypothetical protein
VKEKTAAVHPQSAIGRLQQLFGSEGLGIAAAKTALFPVLKGKTDHEENR